MDNYRIGDPNHSLVCHLMLFDFRKYFIYVIMQHSTIYDDDNNSVPMMRMYNASSGWFIHWIERHRSGYRRRVIDRVAHAHAVNGWALCACPMTMTMTMATTSVCFSMMRLKM